MRGVRRPLGVFSALIFIAAVLVVVNTSNFHITRGSSAERFAVAELSPPQEAHPIEKIKIIEKPCSSKESMEDYKEAPRIQKGTERESSSIAKDTTLDDYAKAKKLFQGYYDNSLKGGALRKEHGPLRIAAFSRLWVPPLHGKGGMQYHALHLYSRLAAFGHKVHVFVTGDPHTAHRILSYGVHPTSLTLTEGGTDLILHQIASDHNGEYSELWFRNTLEVFREVNRSVGGFHVAHSESWAGVANQYQIGLQMAVTWHGSMLDWFRNEMNLIVHNYRMKGKMTSEKQAQRMKDLGTSVAYETYALLTVPHHIVISDSAYDDLVAIDLVEQDRVHLIYNGVNEGNFRPSPDARRTFLAKHGVKSEAFVVGCGGRLEGIKGHHQMSQAMEILLKQYPNVVLFVAGSGQESGRYEKLKAQGLSVHLLGMMTQQDLAAFYQSLDVFVDPFYQHHGLNTVMIEATLSGIPLIATRLASAATTVPSNAFGRSFGLGIISELVGAIKELMENPEERQRIGKNVRERSSRLFTSTVMANSYETLLYSMWLNPKPLAEVTGNVVCKHAYPAMCYREPRLQSK